MSSRELGEEQRLQLQAHELTDRARWLFEQVGLHSGARGRDRLLAHERSNAAAGLGSDGTDGRWRIARRVAPQRVISTVDTQARHTRKSKSARRDGFRGHLAAEPETGLITDVELTVAAGDEGSDAVVGQQLIARDRYQPSGNDSDGGAGAPHVDSEPGVAEPEPSVVAADHAAAQPDSAAAVQAGESHHVAAATGVAAVVDAVVAVTVAALIDGGQPDTARGASLEVYADSAYGGGAARAGCQRGGHDTKPLVPAVAGGFSLDDFPIDEPAGTVSCPGGHTRTMTAKRAVTFGAVCAQCPLRSRCTTAKDGRSMTIHPHEQLLRAARAQARTPEFKRAHPTRSTVERIVAWTATNRGRRIKLRYLGVDKNHAWLRLRCAAINLRTLMNSGLTRTDGAWAVA